MSDPVEFLRRKLTQVETVAKEEARQVARLREQATGGDEPLYCIDDDYHHPLTGDPVMVIRMAEATRKLLEMHQGNHECVSQEDNCVWIDGTHCDTVKTLAEGWGWSDE